MHRLKYVCFPGLTDIHVDNSTASVLDYIKATIDSVTTQKEINTYAMLPSDQVMQKLTALPEQI